MGELFRIFSNRRLLLLLALLLAANGFLFLREQGKKDYGLDLTLPSGGVVVFDGTFSLPEETVDGKAAYGRYLEWLDRVKDLPLEETAARLEKRKEALSDRIRQDEATPEEQTDYVAVNNLLPRIGYLRGYGAYLAGIQENKEKMLSFSLFNDAGSFSGRNILKTTEEFEKLEGVKLTLGADGAVEALLSFRLTDYLLLTALLLICLAFLEERKTGLWSVVHAAPGGRLRLAINRAGILLLSAAWTVMLFYGADLVLGFSLYGGLGDLGRAAQSVEALGRLPALWTVGGFLIRFLLLRIAAAYFTGLLLWLLLSAVSNAKYAIVVAAGALAAEYGFYTLLPVQSGWNLLKYFNLFTYISLSDLYTNYLNIDVFGFPLGIRGISQLALLPLCLWAAAGCVVVQCRKKPAAGRDLLGRLAMGINRITDKGLSHLGLLGMELHKSLWIQKGIVIVALLIYGTGTLQYTVSVPIATAAERVARQYTALFAGEITPDTFSRMDAAQAELEEKLAAYESAKAAYEAGEMDYAQLAEYAQDSSTAKTSLEGLELVRARAQELTTLGSEKGFTPWLLDEIPFESVYGPGAQNNQHRAATAALLALILLLAGSMAYEGQSGMTALLHSTARGRGALLRRKLLLAAMASGFTVGVVYGRELYALATRFSASAWAAPARNLSMLPEFPLNCSVAGWLALLNAYRWLLLFCAGVITLLLSKLAGRMERAYLAATVGLLLPSLLYAYLGVGLFRPLALILPVEAVPLLLPENGAVSTALLWGGAVAALGAGSGYLLFRSAGSGAKAPGRLFGRRPRWQPRYLRK